MRLQYTKKAKADLLDIAIYIARDNLEKAIEFTNILKLELEKLEQFPNMGIKPQKYTIADPTIRVLIIKNYAGLYKVIDDNVFIMCVVNCARLHGIIKSE